MEVTAINKQRFLAELSKLLSFMSSRDRQAVMDQYTEMFDAADDEEALIKELGTPTKVAITLAGDYVPSPMEELPDDPDLPEGEAGEDVGEPMPEAEGTPIPELEFFSLEDESDAPPAPAEEPPTDGGGSEPDGPVFGDPSPSELPFEKKDAREEPPGENSDAQNVHEAHDDNRNAFTDSTPLPDFLNEEEQAPEDGGAVLKTVPTVIYSIFVFIIGLPILLILVLIGTPFMMAGGCIIFVAVYAFLAVMGAVSTIFVGSLSLVSDILLCGGTALIAVTIGFLILWFGIWVSISLARLFIGGVILRLGRFLCIDKEAGEE